ncbi:MAG: hypothetical protein ACXACA_05670 [Candidatus Ranarchaeia archaeon]
MKDFQDLPSMEISLDLNDLNPEYAFNTVYSALAPFKTKSYSLEETGSLEDYSGSTSFSIITGENKFYNTLEVDSTGIKLKIHNEDIETLRAQASTAQESISTALGKVKKLDKKAQYNFSYAVYTKRLIELLLHQLFQKPPAQILYTPVCNVREGLIRMIDGFNPTDQDLAATFQDWTLKYQTLISLTQENEGVEPLPDNNKQTMGLTLLKSKKDIEEYIKALLS